MDYLEQLLKTKNSELGRHLRYSLQGLCASLELALKEARPEDEGMPSCKKLVQELNLLLQEDTFNEAIAENLSDSHPPRLILQHLSDAFFSDETLRYHLGDDLKPRSTTDSDLWEEIQKLLLRIPDPLAQKWKEKTLKLAQTVAAEAESSKVIQLPFSEDKLLYPGLSGSVDAKGIFLSTKAPLDSQITNGNLDEDLKFLAQVVSICLHFIETDPSLHHCLKSIQRFDIVPFDSHQKSKYSDILKHRFQSVQKSETDPVKFLKARLDLDEAINSLVYLPLVKPNCWWGKLQEEARKTLDRAFEKVRNAKAGHNLGLQWLSGVREDIITNTEDDLTFETGGTPGKVMACLRVYAWIDEEKLLGRVIYFPK
jgi:hypothetical protein